MNPVSKTFPGLLFASRISGSLITKLSELCVIVAPTTFKFPVILTSPEIVPPLELYFVLAVENAPLAYEPALVALIDAVLATPKAPLAYEPALVALVDAVLATPNAALA